MSCALKRVLSERLASPESGQLLKDLLIHYKADPQYFVFLKAGLEFSLPRDLGFDERVVRMTCDKCALNPLEECTLVDALLLALEELSRNGNGEIS